MKVSWLICSASATKKVGGSLVFGPQVACALQLLKLIASVASRENFCSDEQSKILQAPCSLRRSGSMLNGQYEGRRECDSAQDEGREWLLTMIVLVRELLKFF
jgi:hypothetical protein